jgi:hypothetical protein
MDEDSVQQQLSLRNFMEELRSAGVDTGGPPAISHKDREAFANQLDRFLRERLRLTDPLISTIEDGSVI